MDDTPKPRCSDCGRPLLTWSEGQQFLMELLQQHFVAVEQMARAGDETGDLKYNTKELKERPVHEHNYVAAFINWLAAHEHTDLKTLVTLISQMTDLRIVVFVNGRQTDIDSEGNGGLGGLDPHTKH